MLVEPVFNTNMIPLKTRASVKTSVFEQTSSRNSTRLEGHLLHSCSLLKVFAGTYSRITGDFKLLTFSHLVMRAGTFDDSPHAVRPGSIGYRNEQKCHVGQVSAGSNLS